MVLAALGELADEEARVVLALVIAKELALAIAKVLALAIAKVLVQAIAKVQVQAIGQVVELETALAVALAKIKLGTAPHRHDQVRARERVEDTAEVAAETTPELVATEAAEAWAAVE